MTLPFVVYPALTFLNVYSDGHPRLKVENDLTSFGPLPVRAKPGPLMILKSFKPPLTLTVSKNSITSGSHLKSDFLDGSLTAKSVILILNCLSVNLLSLSVNSYFVWLLGDSGSHSFWFHQATPHRLLHPRPTPMLGPVILCLLGLV